MFGCTTPGNYIIFSNIPKKKNIYIYSYSCATKKQLYKLHCQVKRVVCPGTWWGDPKNYAFTLLNCKSFGVYTEHWVYFSIYSRVSQASSDRLKSNRMQLGGPWSGIKSYARRQVLSSSFNTTPLSLLSLWVWLEGGRWRILEEKEHIF